MAVQVNCSLICPLVETARRNAARSQANGRLRQPFSSTGDITLRAYNRFCSSNQLQTAINRGQHRYSTGALPDKMQAPLEMSLENAILCFVWLYTLFFFALATKWHRSGAGEREGTRAIHYQLIWEESLGRELSRRKKRLFF